ncbi:MAG: MarR family winged helix-turn-helix transcriptional regulator [Parvularculaceae bacterium]
MSDYQKVLMALRRITRAIDLNSKKLVRRSGLTAPQLLVMRTIDKTGDKAGDGAGDGASDGAARAKPSLIARDVQLSQATVTTILDRLERSGFVRRERSLADRRVVEVELTEAGAAKLRDAPEMLQADFFMKFNQLEDWERASLIASLQRVAAMMDVDDLEDAPILEVGDFSADPGRVH